MGDKNLLFGYVKKFIDERDVVEIITGFKDSTKSKPDLTLFYNMLFDPVGYEGIEEYNGFYAATNVPREQFELPRQGINVLPGDIDIIFIPYNKDRMFFERTAVLEVKIARPHIRKINKPSKSLGSDQVKGLLKDGFPLVGLLHVCMPEPLTEIHASKTKMFKYPIGDDPGPQVDFNDESNFNIINHDWLPFYAIRKQMQRMITSGLPKFVGMNAFGLSLNEDGTYTCTSLREHSGYQSAYFNPSRSKTKAIGIVEKHFDEYNSSYKKLEVWESP